MCCLWTLSQTLQVKHLFYVIMMSFRCEKKEEKDVQQTHFISGESLWEKLHPSPDICSVTQLQHHFPLGQLKLHRQDANIVRNPSQSQPSALQSDLVPTYTLPLYRHNTSRSLFPCGSYNWHNDLLLHHSLDRLSFSVKTLPLRCDSGTLWAGWGERAPRPPTARRGLCCPSYARWHC